VVVASTDFVTFTYAVNPAVPAVFPWLAPLAARYETYKFRSLAFHYRPQVSSASAGTVTLAFDFDALDDPPATLFESMSYHDKSSGSVWCPNSLQLDLSQGDKAPSKYTRVGLPSGTNYDLKTFDLGNLQVCVSGVSAATVGLLEVVYTVDLFTPQIQSPIGGTLTGSAGMDATHMFGTTVTADSNANLPYVVTSSAVITFKQFFEGLLTLSLTGTSLSGGVAPGISADGSASTLWGVTLAAGTSYGGVFRVRAQPGTTMTPTTTGNITAAVWSVASGGYVQYA